MTTMPELAEVEIGVLVDAAEGSTQEAAAVALRAWVVDRNLDQRFADGENGHEVVARMTSAFAAIASAHPGQTVVGHVASVTVAVSCLCGLRQEIWGRPLPHTVPFVVEYDEQSWRCDTWPGQRKARHTSDAQTPGW